MVCAVALNGVDAVLTTLDTKMFYKNVLEIEKWKHKKIPFSVTIFHRNKMVLSVFMM